MSPFSQKIQHLTALSQYMKSDAPEWQQAQAQASQRNAWFIPRSIDLAIHNIATAYLDAQKLEEWLGAYAGCHPTPQTVGIVMAGNIPLVGFHDFLCGYLSGHRLQLKLSSKDDVLLPHLIQVLKQLDQETAEQVMIAEKLTHCQAFIATGSDNSARYFSHYFGSRPHLIRQARTSVAVLDGTEGDEELKALEADVFDYFGLGCRNITQLYVPEGYDFGHFIARVSGDVAITQNHKFRNNYDYHLALYLLNKVPYLSGENLLLVENELPFSAVATLHYQYYTDREVLLEKLRNDDRIQAIVGKGEIPFGKAQQPALTDYADGVDTMAFLCGL